MTEQAAAKVLSDLAPWIEHGASTALAERMQSACLETETEGEKEREIEVASSGKPTKPPRRVLLADDAEWLAEIRAQYKTIGVDVDAETVKARAWLTGPKGRGRQFTRQFLLNWLAKVDRNLADTSPARRPPRDLSTYRGVPSATA
jgi:hypothetical protein